MSDLGTQQFKPLSGYPLVMFDLDGTLVDSVPDIFSALQSALDSVSMPRVTESQCRNWVGNGAQVLVNRALQRRLAVTSDHSLLQSACSEFYEAYAQVNGRLSVLYDGAQALTQTLKANGVHVAVVSNKPYEFALPLLASLELDYDALWGGDSVPNKKPHPDMLQAAMAHFGVQPQECVLVGDSVNDFAAARAAGCKSIAVSYGYNHGKPIDSNDADCIVDSLKELG
jgi:phosphoglycolate phosphatase